MQPTLHPLSSQFNNVDGHFDTVDLGVEENPVGFVHLLGPMYREINRYVMQLNAFIAT